MQAQMQWKGRGKFGGYHYVNRSKTKGQKINTMLSIVPLR
jgi:succinyl-CoA synthetase beta subunit